MGHHHRLLSRALLAAGLLATLASCATSAPAAPAPAATTTAESGAAYADILKARPEPTDAQIRDIAVKLAAIQPELAEVPAERLGRWIDAMCGSIWTQTINPSDLIAGAKGRFNGGDRPPLTDEQAQQIVDTITTTYCH